ncbi:MAG: hypothetical protein IIU97_08210, partial [Bacteroidaceae bacterium]|nr:hypothetical protein [Bacteroidaceae bacterium]
MISVIWIAPLSTWLCTVPAWGIPVMLVVIRVARACSCSIFHCSFIVSRISFRIRNRFTLSIHASIIPTPPDC